MAKLSYLATSVFVFFLWCFVQSQRQTVSGLQCEFPLIVDGVEYLDCVTFDDVEFCQTGDGIWSECSSVDNTGLSSQNVVTQQQESIPTSGGNPAINPTITTIFAPTPISTPLKSPAPVLQAFTSLASDQITITPLSATQEPMEPEMEDAQTPPPVSLAPISNVDAASVPLEDLPGITGVQIDLDESREVGVKTAKTADANVRINEVMVGRGGDIDWIEIINLSDEVINIAFWKLTDLNSSTATTPQVYELGQGECGEIPGLYDIQPGSFLKLSSKVQCSFPFGLGENDGIQLISPDDSIADFFSWKETDISPGSSFIRLPDGGDAPLYFGQPTPGFANEAATGLDFVKSCCSALAGIGFKSELPVMIIDTRTRDIPNEPKISGVFMCTCSGEEETQDDYQGYIGIELRGNTALRDYKKKSYAIEIRDQYNADADFPLLGLPSEEDFVLYGPEEDRSLGLKNIMAYQLSQQLGQYASNYKLIEVFLLTDGLPLNPDHYIGLYVLGEKAKRGKDRIDIQERVGADYAGGYIMKHDNNNYDEGDYWFNTTLNSLEIIVVYPKPRDLSEQEARYIMDYLDSFESALAAKTFKDKDLGYPAYIDIDSFVDYMLVVEAAKNPDGYRGSCYMHKDRGGLLTMGPIWDYNEAFGTCCGYPFEGYDNDGVSRGVSGGSAISPEGWRFNICDDPERCIIDPKDGVSIWYRRLWKDKDFQQRVAAKWQQARLASISDAWVDTFIEDFRSLAKPAAMRNYERWGDTIGEEWFANYDEQWTYYVDRLKEWLLAHMQWMDQEFIKYE